MKKSELRTRVAVIALGFLWVVFCIVVTFPNRGTMATVETPHAELVTLALRVDSLESVVASLSPSWCRNCRVVTAYPSTGDSLVVTAVCLFPEGVPVQ